MAQREWTVGDRVFVYGAHSGRFEQESKVVKVYKNGNFLVEFRNYLNEPYTEQFSGKYSDGHYARATGEGWYKRHVRFVTPELELQEAANADLKERKAAQSELYAKFRTLHTLTASQLQRINAIIDEEQPDGQA